MYSGRKWFLARYPQLTDAAVVAFHQVRGQCGLCTTGCDDALTGALPPWQDGPLRSAQTAQVFAKAGMRYLKHSRYSEKVYRFDDAPSV